MRVEDELVGVRDLRRGAWIGRLAMLALWLAGAAVFSGVGHLAGTAVGCWTPLALLVGTSILLGLRHGAFAGATQPLARGSLAIEGGTIEVVTGGQRRTFRIEDVVGGWTEPEPHRGVETAILLLRDGTEVRFACSRAEVIEHVMREAGVAPDQRAVKMRVRPGLGSVSRAIAIFVTFVAAMLMLVCLFVTLASLYVAAHETGAALFSVVFGIFTFAFAAVVRRLGPSLFTTTVSIGTDGVVIERLAGKRLLRRAEIEDAVQVLDTVELRLRSGETVRISASSRAAATVVNRIGDALQAGARAGVVLERLEREGRPVRAWIADLRALAVGARGYRRAALARNDLLDVVKDGAAPAERRIAAAVALSGERDDETRAALRIAADTCVDERLRVVLRGAEEMSEEDLVDAVAEAVATR